MVVQGNKGEKRIKDKLRLSLLVDSSLMFCCVLQASQREDSYEETIRDLTQRLKDVSMNILFHNKTCKQFTHIVSKVAMFLEAVSKTCV
jgi:hypothetical protein